MRSVRTDAHSASAERSGTQSLKNWRLESRLKHTPHWPRLATWAEVNYSFIYRSYRLLGFRDKMKAISFILLDSLAENVKLRCLFLIFYKPFFVTNKILLIIYSLILVLNSLSFCHWHFQNLSNSLNSRSELSQKKVLYTSLFRWLSVSVYS